MLAARHKNYLINPSPCLASQAGWRLPAQFCTEDDKLLRDNSSVSSSCLNRRRMRPISPWWARGLGQRDARRTRAPCSVPLPRARAGRWREEPGEKLGSAQCCCTAEGMGFSPKTWLQATKPQGGWVRGAGATWHSSSEWLGCREDIMHSSCHATALHQLPRAGGHKPARAWDPAVTPPGQAATPPASLTGQARSSSMQGRAGREFPARNFPVMCFMGCRSLTIERFQATGGLSPKLAATHSQPSSGEQPYKNKPGHPSQH